jgi:hypothetical protein
MSYNSAILIIRHFIAFPRLKLWFIPEKSYINGSTTPMDMFKKALKSVCTSTIVVSPNRPRSPTLSTSSAMETPENTEEDPDDPEQADEGDIQKEYCSYWLYCPNIEAVTKNYLYEIRYYRYCLIIQNIK